MLDIFLRLKTLIKVSHIHIDSSVFRLHWSISSVILLTFSVIITTRQYVGNPIECIHTQVEKKQKKKLLLDYLYDNLKNHNWWAYRYFFCELLALLNVCGQMFLMDRFFNGAFLTFGLEVIAFAERDQSGKEGMIILSPRMRAYLLYIRFRLIKREVVNTLVKKSKMGDWFLFYMLGQNVDSIIFKEVMHELARRLGHQSKDFNDA
ncbi:innexin shaking-B [Eurytemora carolleeae]|uniref:innexin shaking-B n=1 Tax=Eurytemora carolleeae TaxID=1294199 RepID=UPI000C76837C|nr:innexin shaking-B [Eurytemora carolleeae]|eukprot:XP_023349349.1 innexin shaking-B-like [Eurytemora affinis]